MIPYTFNKNIPFDENLLVEFSKESSIPMVKPFGQFKLAIKLNNYQEACVYDIGYPAMISRYILKNYMEEDYDVFLKELFNNIKRYGKFIDITFLAFIKQSMTITLANDYQSIKDIESFGIEYNIIIDRKKSDDNRVVNTNFKIVFEGESCYDIKLIGSLSGNLEFVINYHDVDGFFIKFIDAYKDKFAKKLGVKSSTDSSQMRLLIDMITF